MNPTQHFETRQHACRRPRYDSHSLQLASEGVRMDGPMFVPVAATYHEKKVVIRLTNLSIAHNIGTT